MAIKWCVACGREYVARTGTKYCSGCRKKQYLIKERIRYYRECERKLHKQIKRVQKTLDNMMCKDVLLTYKLDTRLELIKLVYALRKYKKKERMYG